MLVFFTNLNLMEFQVRHLALFLLFSVINRFEWFWMGSLHENIQLMLEFLKAPFVVLHFSCYTLMTFLLILSDDIIYVDDTIRHLVSELDSDLQDTVNWGRKWLVDLNAAKTQLVSFEQSNNTGFIYVK